MRAAVYARVSTVNNGQSPEMQLRDFSEYCERRGWTVAGEYVDVGISGTKEKRPELDRLMKEAHGRRFRSRGLLQPFLQPSDRTGCPLSDQPSEPVH